MAQLVVKLVGHEFDLKALSKLLTTVDCRVAQGSDDAYYLTSEEFASMTEGSDIHGDIPTQFAHQSMKTPRIRNCSIY